MGEQMGRVLAFRNLRALGQGSPGKVCGAWRLQARFPLAPTYDAPPGTPAGGIVVSAPSDRMFNLEGPVPGHLGGGPAALARLGTCLGNMRVMRAGNGGAAFFVRRPRRLNTQQLDFAEA